MCFGNNIYLFSETAFSASKSSPIFIYLMLLHSNPGSRRLVPLLPSPIFVFVGVGDRMVGTEACSPPLLSIVLPALPLRLLVSVLWVRGSIRRREWAEKMVSLVSRRGRRLQRYRDGRRLVAGCVSSRFFSSSLLSCLPAASWSCNFSLVSLGWDGQHEFVLEFMLLWLWFFLNEGSSGLMLRYHEFDLQTIKEICNFGF